MTASPLVPLAGLLSERRERNAAGTATVVFSVTNSRGLAPADTQFDKRVHSADIDGYRVVRPGQFAYNPARVNVGSIDYLRADTPVAVSPMYVVFETTDPRLYGPYLLYFLRSPVGMAAIRRNCQGSVRAVLPFSALGHIPIPLPSVSEQRRIVAILDEADAARRNRRRSLEIGDELLPSLFLDMFGDPVSNPKEWPVLSLNDLLAPHRSVSYGVLKRGADVADGIPLIDATSVNGGTVRMTDLKHISPALHAEYSRTQLRGGEVVVTIRGTVGRAGVVPLALAGGNVSRQIALVPIREDVPAQFVVSALMSPSIQCWMMERVRGVAQRGINLADLRRVPIPLPPRPGLQRFAEMADEVQRMRDCQEASLARLDELFDSLLHRAFAGQLPKGTGRSRGIFDGRS